MGNALLELIGRGEGLHLDFKHCINDSQKIARSLAAFANTGGGTLLLGVRDNGTIAGVASDEEYYMTETAALLYCKPEVGFSVAEHKIYGKTVVEVQVPPSPLFPHKAPDYHGRYKVFVRVDDSNVLADKIWIETERRKRHLTTNPQITIDDTVRLILAEIENNGSVSKEQVIRICGITSRKAENILINLTLMNIIDIKMSKKGSTFVTHCK